MPIVYGLYARKSSESEERQLLSIPAQIKEGKARFPDLIIGGIYRDEKTAHQPGVRGDFKRLIADLDSGKIQGVISWHPDRLSRNEIDGADITYRIRTGVIKDLKFSTYFFINSPEGIVMLQQILNYSQYSSSKLSVDVKRGIETKVDMKWRPGLAPCGYRNITTDQGVHVIVNDQKRFKLVRKMWDLLLEANYTPSRIVEIAHEEWGFTTIKRRKIGGGPLSRSALYAIFRNPFYAGYFRHNGQLVQGNHNAMVTLEEFRRAQHILDRRYNRKNRVTPRHRFPYTNLIKCDECEASYTADIHKGHTYYHCTHSKPRVTCMQRKQMREETVEAGIIHELRDVGISPEFHTYALAWIERERGGDIEAAKSIDDNRKQQIGTLKKRLNGLIDMMADGLIDRDSFAQRQDAVTSEILTLEEQASRDQDRNRRLAIQTRRAFDLAAYAEDIIRHGSQRKKRRIAQAIGKEYRARDGQLHVHLQDFLVPIAEANRHAIKEAGQQSSEQGDLKSEDHRTETVVKKSSTEAETSAFALDVSTWQGIVHEVRTAVESVLDQIELPEFDAFGNLAGD